MAELSYPTTGGGSVTDANYENLIGTSMPSGLIGTGTAASLVYGDSTGRQVKVRANRAAMVRGYRWQTDGAGIVRSIGANTSGQSRIDLAVLRLNRADWTVTFQIVQGTPAASPVAPSPTQTEGPSGTWELPVAQIAVANQSANILAADVVDRGVYLNSNIYDAPKAYPPVAGLQPRLYYGSDNGRLYLNSPNGWGITGEYGSVTTSTASPSWSAQILRFVRINGFVWMMAQITRTGANLAASTQSVMFTIPAAFRPMTALSDFALVGYAGANPVRCYVDTSGGTVYLQDYTFQFNTNNTVTIHPAVWPAQNT